MSWWVLLGAVAVALIWLACSCLAAYEVGRALGFSKARDVERAGVAA